MYTLEMVVVICWHVSEWKGLSKPSCMANVARPSPPLILEALRHQILEPARKLKFPKCTLLLQYTVVIMSVIASSSQAISARAIYYSLRED